MAILAAVDIMNMMTWGDMKVYTVGAPRVGNHAYARMYNKLVPDTWGIINYRVSVTSLPLCRHPGTCICQKSTLLLLPC